MKKILLFVMVVMMLFSAAACRANNKNNNTETSPTPDAQTENDTMDNNGEIPENGVGEDGMETPDILDEDLTGDQNGIDGADPNNSAAPDNNANPETTVMPELVPSAEADTQNNTTENAK